ncbi:VRR-NUC domain-containing protein [Methylorubrum aminovorans]
MRAPSSHHQGARRLAARNVPMRESAIQAAVVQHWRLFGQPHTLVAAIPNEAAKGQAGLTKGLPDLLVIGGRVRIAFLELKVPTGRLSLEQKLFRNLCAFVGIEFVAAYGRDEPIAVLERWGIVRPNLNGPVR